MYYPILRPRAQRQLKKIEQADLVIGLPSYKNPQAAAYVAQVALKGAHEYYPELRTVLVNADAGYKATTRQAVARQAEPTKNGHIVVSGRYDGPRGQGSAIAALLDAALALDAKALLVLDSYTQSITPSWISGLAHLILEDRADLVFPRYRRWHAPEGTLNDLVGYPLFRALWGQSVRHPIAPDFAMSPKLATTVLDEDVWGTSVAKFGLPPWLISYGSLGRWRVAQSVLGEKIAAVPFVDNSSRKRAERRFRACFQDNVGVFFRLIRKYKDNWKRVESFHSVPTLTEFASEAISEAVDDEDVVRLLDDLALGWIEYRRLWQKILTPDNLAHIEALATLPPDSFYFPADLWARVVYDFALVFNRGEVDPLQVVEALFPLYQGRKAAFWHEVAGLAFVGREGTTAAQAVEFEETREYFKHRWQSYRP